MREHKSVKGRAMARARTIKPGILTNEQLAALGPHAYILFTGLWMIADREGRLEDRPKRIWAEVMALWGVTWQDVENLLMRLAENDFIDRYAVKGKRYISIKHWCKHQHIHPAEKASTLPAYNSARRVKQPLIQVSTFEMSESKCDLQKTYEVRRRVEDTSLVNPRDIPRTSLPSLPSLPSLHEESSVIERVSTTDICASGDARVGAKNGFDEFWKERWRSKDKAGAQKAFAKFANTPERAAAIMAALRKQKPEMEQCEMDKRPYMTTWLNKRRFEDTDEPEDLLLTAAEIPRRIESFDDMRSRAAMETALKFAEEKKYGSR